MVLELWRDDRTVFLPRLKIEERLQWLWWLVRGGDKASG